MIPCPDCGEVKLEKDDTSLCHTIDGCRDRLITISCDCGYKKLMILKSEQLKSNTVWEVIDEAIQV